MSTHKKITPVILAGGSGTRLWPLSRTSLPKQFCALTGSKSLFQQTLLRTSDRVVFNEPVIIANRQHQSTIQTQAAELGVDLKLLIAEPHGRDTAAAIALAAETLVSDPDNLALVLPSDHQVGNEKNFIEAVTNGIQSAGDGNIVTFGIQPTKPETGYGYIRAGQPIVGSAAHDLQGFVEKPCLTDAELLVQERHVYWNAGMFLFDPKVVVHEFETLAEPIIHAVRRSLKDATQAPGVVYPDPESFARVRKISFDYAIMELTDRAAVVPMDPKWSDLGSWNALWENKQKDHQGNVAQGKVFFADAGNSLAISTGPVVGVAGLDDVVVVANKDAVMVTSRHDSQSVKTLVHQLDDQDLPVVNSHSGETRPWGNFDSLDKGDMHQVKRISVKPGGRLSLQYHHHRMEHWIVVTGIATVTVNDEVRDLNASEQIFIPQGAVHRLENFTDEPVEIIEVQYGSYLGEDDIVRVEDVYGRPEEEHNEAA